jgi:hypothetical protein
MSSRPSWATIARPYLKKPKRNAPSFVILCKLFQTYLLCKFLSGKQPNVYGKAAESSGRVTGESPAVLLSSSRSVIKCP